MTVTAETPWRETGNTTVAGLIAEFRTQGDSPLVEEAARLLAAAGGFSRLMAAISFVEQKHATYQGVIPKASHNFLSLASGWKAGAHTWETFTSYAACAARWKQLLTDPAGAYRNATTIRDLINVYAPPTENDVDRYVRQAVEVINRMPLAAGATPLASPGGTTMSATSPITFGNVVAPPVVHRDIDPELNTAWDDLGQRRPRFVVLHRMAGSLAGTDEYFRTDARTRARTDYGIDHRTGEIWRWTDPLGRLAPYASGPWTSPPGDGIALVAKLGQSAINRDGISLETSGFKDDTISETGFSRLVQLIAYWADWCEIPYPSWPINPETGLTFVYWHGEFNGAKGPGTEHDCPGSVIRGMTTRLITRVGEILRDAQSVEVTGSVPPTPQRPPRSTAPVVTPTPPTAIALPAGVDLTLVSGWFGSVASNGDRAMTFAFDANGPVTKLWLEHGRETGTWPQLVSVTETDGGRVFRFDGGWTVRGTADGTVEEVAA